VAPPSDPYELTTEPADVNVDDFGGMMSVPDENLFELAGADPEASRLKTEYPELKKEAIPALGAAIRTVAGATAGAPLEIYQRAQSLSPVPAQMESFKVNKSDFLTQDQIDPRRAYRKAKTLGLSEEDAAIWKGWADTERVLDKKKTEQAMRDIGVKPLTERIADILDPQVLRDEKILHQIERLAADDTGIGRAWKSGNLNFVMDQYVGDHIFAGDKAQTKKVLALRKKVKKALEENAPEKRGMVVNTLNSLAQMAPPMIKTGIKGAIPFVGKSIMLYDWGRQGAGEVYAELRDAGVTHKTAKEIAPTAGLLYAGIEQL